MMRTFLNRIWFGMAVLAAALIVEGVFMPAVSEAAITSVSHTVKVAQDAKLGAILTDSQGMTGAWFVVPVSGSKTTMNSTATKGW